MNRDYCMKGAQSKDKWDETNVPGPNYGIETDTFEKGKCPSAGQRTDLEAACERIDEGASMKAVAKEFNSTFVHNLKGLYTYQLISSEGYHSDSPRGIWIWDPSGVGKSKKAHDDYSALLFDKAQNKWFCGYPGEETILINNFDQKGVCLSHYLKCWTDHYPCTGETKSWNCSPPPQIFGNQQIQHQNTIW
ncbi:hypothetical protein ACA910_014828 [Epithemia clementina (nom. ined.)]